MNPVYLLIVAVLCPAVVGAMSMALPRAAVSRRVWVCTAAPIVSLCVFGWYIAAHGTAATPPAVDGMPSLQLSVSFQPDRLGLFFALLVAAFGVLITLYARAYFGPD